MADSIQAQLEQLRNSVTALEAQRAVLGDAVVGPAIASLKEKIAALETQALAEAAPAEERRLVTIFFSDVVGSTSLAEKLDPEEWRRTVARIHSSVGGIIAKHSGKVVQYLGDGLLALFGAEQSSEDDPEDAIRAALDAQAEVASWKLEVGPKPAEGAPPSYLQIRVGIHSGLVVVGELGAEAHKEFTATGDAMNLAARLQSAAPPGGIIISHDTYRYVRGYFDVTPQPPLTVKGKSEPVRAYLVRRARPRPFLTVTRGVAGVRTRTVGRAEEIQKLQAAYLDACGNNRVTWAQLLGEPGIGKSRLINELNEWLDLREETAFILRARAYLGQADHPFTLVRRMWFDRFQIPEEAPVAQAETKWMQQFGELQGKADPEAAQAVGRLVGLPIDDGMDAPLDVDSAQVKGRGLTVSRELLGQIRQKMPVVVLLEDIHWADEASLDYLEKAALEAGEAKAPARPNGVFVLASARPEFRAPEWLQKLPCYLPIEVGPLSREATRELVLELLHRVEAVPEEVVDLIVEQSEGVPYFAEELVNWFMDHGIVDKSREPWRFVSARLQEHPLPATLEHLLLARLSDLTPAEREALQRGAVFGRHFWPGGLDALGVPGGDQVLSNLQSRGLVGLHPSSTFDGETEWTFHHTLLREVAYESLLKSDRAALHKAAANWLEEQAEKAGRVDEFAGHLAEHYERAGDTLTAADWYTRAGERAHVIGASAEARRFFDKAISLLPPVERERRWRALLGREAVLEVLGETEARRSELTGLLELARQFEDERLAQVYFRRAVLDFETGEYADALEASEAGLEAARRVQDKSLEVRLLANMAAAETRLGNLEAASSAAEETEAGAQGLDDETQVFVLDRLGIYYTESGDLVKGQEVIHRQVDLAHKLGDRQEEAEGLVDLGENYAELGMFKQAHGVLERGLELAEAIGDRPVRGYALLNLGLVYFRTGDGRAGQDALERALADLTAVEDKFGKPLALFYLALNLEQSDDLSGAARRYQEAFDTWCGIGASEHCVEAQAGLARCALAQGELDKASENASAVWMHVTEAGTEGMELPGLVYQTLADVFDALGQKDQARSALEVGYNAITARAERIDNPEWRRSYLQAVPEHSMLVSTYEQAKAQEAGG